MIGKLGAARIDHSHRLQRVAPVVELQVQRVGDARVDAERLFGEIKFVVAGVALAFQGQEHGMAIGAPGLQPAQVAVVLRRAEDAHHLVLAAFFECFGIKLHHLLPQRHALASAHCLAPFIASERRVCSGIDHRLRQAGLDKARSGEGGFVARRQILLLEQAKDVVAVFGQPGVIPGDGLDWCLVQRVVLGEEATGRIRHRRFLEGLSIHLLHPTEPAELALVPIEVTVVVAVGAVEGGVAPGVVHGDLADAMHWEWQARQPGRAGLLVL